MAAPDPSQVAPWYLRNITQALALNESTGNVYVRTDAQLTIGNVGNVIVSEVSVNDLGNIDISGNTMPVSGNVTVFQGTTPWSVTGNVTASLTGNALPSGKPFELQVAQGLVPGTTGLSISGYNASVGTDWVPIWDQNTAYTYFNTAQQVRVWSSSASDTNIYIQVNGLNSSYGQISETVHLTNSTTGVLTSQSFYRINTLVVTADPVNVGTIYAGDTGKTIVLASIPTGTGRSQQTTYTVPAGYTFYLTQVNVYTNQVGSQTGLYRSWTKSVNGVINIILTFPFTDSYLSRKVVPRPYPEKTDIQWQAQSSQGTSRVGAQIEGYLIAN